MFRRIIRRLVSEEIDRRAADIPKRATPQSGYNSLEKIRGGVFHWHLVPVNGEYVWMELKTLNATQLESCGAVTLVEALRGGIASDEDLIDIRNRQELIVKETLNRPSFDDIVQVLTMSDFVWSKHKAEIDELKKIDLTGLTAAQKADIDDRINAAELSIAFILPEDMFDYIVRFALGVDVSDIKKISRDKLLEAAILAKNGSNDPTDHIDGVFTDRDKGDINKAAWIVYNDYMEEKKIENNASGRKWIGRK